MLQNVTDIPDTKTVILDIISKGNKHVIMLNFDENCDFLFGIFFCSNPLMSKFIQQSILNT